MNQILDTFFEKRQRLLDALSATGQNVGSWYAARKVSEPTLRDSALLEGLLAERRNLLESLMKLDDDMLANLVRARSQLSERTGLLRRGEDDASQPLFD